MAEPIYEYNAQQFVNLAAEQTFYEQHKPDFFVSDDGHHDSNSRIENVTEDQNGQDPVASPCEKGTSDTHCCRLRKSLSVGTLVLFSENALQDEALRKNMAHLSLADDGFPARNASLDTLSKRGPSKKIMSTETLSHKPSYKFISFAESVSQFQNGTPTRFRTKPDPNKKYQHPQRTIPHSPALQTKTRHRNIHIPSQEEKELEDYENAKKFKIKAHPVSQKVLRGPVKAAEPVAKKPTTIPIPFAITCPPPKKVAPSSPDKFEFRARPAPKYLREQPSKPVRGATRPPSKGPGKIKTESAPPEKKKPMELTKVEPFTFEERDKMCMSKRQQLIDRILEEEKRAREFHARPVPKSIYKGADSSGSSTASSKRSESRENVCPQFKARPPVVLSKEPFVPKKADRPGVAVEPFLLSTEQRAAEREEFRRELLEKEERAAEARRLAEERARVAEQHEIARLRRAAEVKAQPVRKYKELVIIPSNKVTEPVSPKFLSNKTRNTENVSDNPGGAPSRN